MSLAQTVIARCTTNGHTRWQHVAAQLGRCIDSVRAEHDPTYLRAYIWAPSREARPEMDVPEDIDSTRSPHAKGAGVRIELLALLARRTLPAETLARLSGIPANSARARLSDMATDGLVSHDGNAPGSTYHSIRTWAITEKGREALASHRANPMRRGAA